MHGCVFLPPLSVSGTGPGQGKSCLVCGPNWNINSGVGCALWLFLWDISALPSTPIGARALSLFLGRSGEGDHELWLPRVLLSAWMSREAQIMATWRENSEGVCGSNLLQWIILNPSINGGTFQWFTNGRKKKSRILIWVNAVVFATWFPIFATSAKREALHWEVLPTFPNL